MVERYQMGGPAGSIDEPSKGFWPKTADLRVALVRSFVNRDGRFVGAVLRTRRGRTGSVPAMKPAREKSVVESSRRISASRVARRILELRGRRVIIDADLAVLYGVTTKALNQAVKRNRDRFPAEFMFVLDAGERLEVVTICDHLRQLKFSRAPPTAFTEHGAIMVATVLKTRRAVEMSVFVVRAFVELRDMLARNSHLARKLAELEQKISRHDKEIVSIVAAVRRLALAPARPRRGIGFTADLGD